MDFEFETTRTSLANAFAAAGANWLACTGIVDTVIAAIPDTQPQKYAVAGTLPGILQMAGKMMGEEGAPDAAEPVAWMQGDGQLCTTAESKKKMENAGFGHWAEIAARYSIPLYAAPIPPVSAAEKPTGDLTDDELMDIAVPFHNVGGVQFDEVAFARAPLPAQGNPAAWMVGLDVFKTREQAEGNVRNPDLKPVPLYLAAPAQAGDAQDEWQPIMTAPKDGTMLRLLVNFSDNATEDTSEPCVTIGANNFDNDGIDEWKFAGWNWQHDCFTEGKGAPVHWMPMIERAAMSASQDKTQEAK